MWQCSTGFSSAAQSSPPAIMWYRSASAPTFFSPTRPARYCASATWLMMLHSAARSGSIAMHSPCSAAMPPASFRYSAKYRYPSAKLMPSGRRRAPPEPNTTIFTPSSCARSNARSRYARTAAPVPSGEHRWYSPGIMPFIASTGSGASLTFASKTA